MSDLQSLHEQINAEENISSVDEIYENDNDNNFEENSIPNELRQRHVTTDHSNNSYDLLEKDLAYLREAIDEVNALVAKQQRQQEELLSRTEHLRNTIQSRFHNVSSFFQKAIHNQYVSLASGAVLGASIGGPVGFTMGAKVGTLVALTGSALGALSMNIMRQRVTETDESETNNTIAYNQAML
jgi:hypothetical protein